MSFNIYRVLCPSCCYGQPFAPPAPPTWRVVTVSLIRDFCQPMLRMTNDKRFGIGQNSPRSCESVWWIYVVCTMATHDDGGVLCTDGRRDACGFVEQIKRYRGRVADGGCREQGGRTGRMIESYSVVYNNKTDRAVPGRRRECDADRSKQRKANVTLWLL